MTGPPFIDAGNGGSIDGIISFCEEVLKVVNDKTIVVPGHGPISTTEDLQTYIDMLIVVRDRIQEGIQQGKGLQEIIDTDPTKEWRDKFQGSTPLLLTPHSTEDVQKIVKMANKIGVKLAIQGGNTGLVGGNTPGLEDRDEVLISMQKMASIEQPCAQSMTIVAEAGAILSHLQEKASPFYFPLSLASEGSCTIGGNMATNAGGIHVIKYGMLET